MAVLRFFAIGALPTGYSDTSSAADALSHLGQCANIRDRMRAYGVQGISIAVINAGRIDWAKGYGLTETATRTPVTSDTLFEAASISKPLAALGALTLVETR